MCISDWRLGRLVRSVSRQIVDPSNTPTIYASNQRVGLTVWGDITTASSPADFYMLVDGVQVGTLGMINQPFQMTILTHGDLVQKTLQFVGALNPIGTFYVTEYFLPEEYLVAGLDEFRRQAGMLPPAYSPPPQPVQTTWRR